MNQGQFANRAGEIAENLLGCVIRGTGLRFRQHHYLCKSIYGHPIKVDFFIENSKDHPGGLVIECKWQDTKGSVDEKFPYLVANIKERFPCPAVIVCGGSGQKSGAIDWLKDQVDGTRLLAVFDVEEFVSWMNRKVEATP